MSAHSASRASRLRRGAVTATATALSAAFIVYGGAATASPGPTADQLRQKINRLMTQLDRVDQQYARSITELKTATASLKRYRQESARAKQKFEQLRTAMAQIGAAAYEQGDLNSTMALLASDNPQVVLDRADLLNHLSSNRHAQLASYVSAARAVVQASQRERRVSAAISQITKQKAAQKQRLQQLVAKNQADLRRLTAPAPTPAAPTSTTPVAGAGAARIAVQYALSKVGVASYEWGATGPNAFDCSGLVMAAWAAAGVSIPRTTYEQWAALPHVSSSSMQPGDLLFYDSEGHVAIYVGNGMIVDAPQPGELVEEIPMSTSWYASTFDGAARP